MSDIGSMLASGCCTDNSCRRSSPAGAVSTARRTGRVAGLWLEQFGVTLSCHSGRDRREARIGARPPDLDTLPGPFALLSITTDERGETRPSALPPSRQKARPDPFSLFRSAMSMLNFYINRGGKNLAAAQRDRLEAAKDELRALYGRPRARQAG